MSTPPAASFPLGRRLVHHARPYGIHVAGVLLLSLLSTPLALLAPLPLKMVVDALSGADPVPRFLAPVFPTSRSDGTVLTVAIVLLVAVSLLGHVQTLLITLLTTYAGEHMVLDLRLRLFQHLQRLPMPWHDRSRTADTTYRIQYDAPAIQYIVVDGLVPSVTAGVTLLAMIGVVVRLDWQLAVVAVGISAPLYLAARVERRPLRQRARDTRAVESTAMAVVQEVLGALRVVKAFGQERREEARFRAHAVRGLRGRLELAALEGGLGLVVGTITAAGSAAVLLIGVHHVRTGLLTLGDLLLVMGYLGQTYEPVRTISRKIAALQSHLVGAERSFALLDEPTEAGPAPTLRPLIRARGAITFRDVSFAQGDRPVLHGVSFDVPAGARVGIAGTSGAGKTTLVGLLTRFDDPSAGQVLLDGVDVREYDLADLRNQFAVVLQESVLFSTTIADNIGYGRPGASLEEIVAAAEAANAHVFISGLPHGYRTLVGERGVFLSGGERQRIALARAFLKDAPILVLDEPTSAVDTSTEAGIMTALDRLMQGRTTFVVAHRLATLERCDIRLWLEHGRLVGMPSGPAPATSAAPPGSRPTQHGNERSR
jgi:ATP-binding cassette subfamily B protein